MIKYCTAISYMLYTVVHTSETINGVIIFTLKRIFKIPKIISKYEYLPNTYSFES